MQRYACKFCIALRGLKGTEVKDLPDTREEAEAHVRAAHGYPGRSAAQILGSVGERGLAAKLIENSGPVLVVHPAQALS